MTTIIPLKDRAVIRRTPPKEKTSGGLFIPDSAQEKMQEGEVIAVGKGRTTEEGKLIPLDLKVGDKVLFDKYLGSEVKVDGEELVIMKEDDIFGVI